MSLDDLHTLDTCIDDALRPDADSIPGLFSYWLFCQ